jgi:tetratricopeptide (TPR) repeat protein
LRYFVAYRNTLTQLLWIQGQFKDAAKNGGIAVLNAEQVCGKDHPFYITALKQLGYIYRHLADLPAAENHLKDALAVSSRMLGENHAETWNCMSELALVYQEQGRLGEAEELQSKELAMCEKVRGRDHPETHSSMNNLIFIWLRMRRYTDAEHLQRDLITRQQRLLDTNRHYILRSRKQLATILKASGNLAEAKSIVLQLMLCISDVSCARKEGTFGYVNEKPWS